MNARTHIRAFLPLSFSSRPGSSMNAAAPVPFLNLKAINERHRLAFREAFERVMDSGWVLLGEETAAFEAAFAAYCA